MHYSLYRLSLILVIIVTVLGSGIHSLKSTFFVQKEMSSSCSKECSCCHDSSKKDTCKCGCAEKFVQESSFKACVTECSFQLIVESEVLSYHVSVQSFTVEPLSLISPPPRIS